MSKPDAIQDIPIGGDSIRLGQFMKFAGLLDSGGDVKEAIIDGYVTVNGDALAILGERFAVRWIIGATATSDLEEKLTAICRQRFGQCSCNSPFLKIPIDHPREEIRITAGTIYRLSQAFQDFTFGVGIHGG